MIARKWRPKNFEQLIGQNHVSQTLINAMKNNRLHHALLFNGPRGTGKTSSARILAKSLRCLKKKNFIPCNKCTNCIEISEGRNLDTVEIDGASNNGVDAMRELRETIKYRPSNGQYKIYIIDEVHMLSTSAFNALLKTLEEPPSHVVFILATTEVHKLPLTILSRLQRFDFRRISTHQITTHLENICDKDKITFDKESLWAIARLGDGSMRDSQSLLDQAVTFCDGHLSLAKVTVALGLTDRQLIMNTFEALITRKQSLIIDIIEKIFSSGYDIKLFALDLLEEIRHGTLIKTTSSDSSNLTSIIDLPDSEIEFLGKLVSKTSKEDLHFLFDMTLKGIEDIQRSDHPRMSLEMLLLRMVNAPSLESIDGWLRNNLSSQKPVSELNMGPTPETSLTESNKGPAPETSLTKSNKGPTPETSLAESNKEPTSNSISKGVSQEDSKKTPQESWHGFTKIIRDKNPRLGGMIENLVFSHQDEKTIYLTIPKNFSFLKRSLNKKTVADDLKKEMNSFWKTDRAVAFLEEGKGDDQTKKTSSSLSPKLSPKEHEKKTTEKEKTRIDKSALNHENVQSIKNIFSATVETVELLNTTNAPNETNTPSKTNTANKTNTTT